MQKTIYLGMMNEPHEVFVNTTIVNFRVVNTYYNTIGKKIMLQATRDSLSYSPAHNYMQYVNQNYPALKKGSVNSFDVLDLGYSAHDFKIVEV